MKFKITVLLVFLLLTNSVFAQKSKNEKNDDSRFSLAINIPLHFNENPDVFLISGYVGLDLNYKIVRDDIFNVGASLTSDYLRSKRANLNSKTLSDYKGYSFNHLDAFFEFKTPGLEELIFFTDVGYSLLVHDNNFSIEGGFDPIAPAIKEISNFHNGYNFKLGAKFNFNPRFFIHAYFHETKIYMKQPVFVNINEATSIKQNYTQLKIGVGLNF